MSVYVANIFVALLNHATKLKEVEIQEKVFSVLFSNGSREKRPEIREIPQNTGDLALAALDRIRLSLSKSANSASDCFGF